MFIIWQKREFFNLLVKSSRSWHLRSKYSVHCERNLKEESNISTSTTVSVMSIFYSCCVTSGWFLSLQTWDSIKAAEQWEWLRGGTSWVSGRQQRLRCRTGSECTVDHKLHGGSYGTQNETVNMHYNVEDDKQWVTNRMLLYLFTGRSQQNIDDKIIDGRKVVKRTWRRKK